MIRLSDRMNAFIDGQEERQKLKDARSNLLAVMKAKAEKDDFREYKRKHREFLAHVLGPNPARIIVEDNTWSSPKEFEDMLQNLYKYYEDSLYAEERCWRDDRNYDEFN